MRSLCFVALAALAACSADQPHSASREPVRIGYIGPITGDAASFGADTLNGARLAVAEINETGGIHGLPVSLIAEDGRCRGADAAQAARKLVNVDRVSGIIGGHCSSETLAAAPIVEEAGVPMISPLSSSPDITNAGDFVFRVYPSDEKKGKAFANYFAQMQFTRIAIISEKTDFCLGVRSTTHEAFERGTDYVFDELVEPGTKDYAGVIQRLQEVEFDVLIANNQSPTTIAALLTEMRAMGIEQPVVGTDAADSLTLAQLAPEASEGLRVLSVPSLNPDTPIEKAFMDSFTEAYRTPEAGFFFAALSYEAGHILLETIRTVGTEGPAIRDAFYASSGHTDIIGTVSFDPYGDVRGIPFALKEFQGGDLVEVERIPLE